MKHYLVALFTIFISLFTFAPVAFAKVMWQEKGKLTIPVGETIDDDLFIASENVAIDGTVNGSVFVGAGNVAVSGNIKGDLLIGTGQADLSGVVSGDLYIGAGNITLSKLTVGGNVVTAAGNLTIDETSKIGGSLITGVGNLKNSAPVGRSIMVGAGMAYLDNKVGRELRFGGRDLELGPHASIAGNVTYALGEERGTFKQDPSATIGGTVSKYTPPVQAQRDMTKVKSDLAKFGRAFHGTWLVISFLGSLLVGFFLLKLFPKTSLGLTSQITKSPMPSLGIGFLIMILAFPVFLVLALTVIGLPLAGLLFLLFCLEVHLAKLVSAYALGRFVAGQFSWNKLGVYAVFGIGLALFYFLRAIPMIGWISSNLFTWAGLGAMWHYASAHQKNL
ncbi:MAG: polymer-forming cytoskeletal protein [bacterium]